MKKILFLLCAAVCAFAACDPTHEDIGNGGHISAEQLNSMSSVTVDKAASGQNGNVITCKTSAPVNAKWTIAGKDFIGNYAWKKMKLGQHTVYLTALCADGTPDFDLKVMNGWWSATYYDHVKWTNGLNELQLTDQIYKDCAKGKDGRDLDLMLYSGSMTLKSVYYEE